MKKIYIYIYIFTGSTKHSLSQFYDEIIQTTTLDGCVLDYLISKCLLTIDDRAEVTQCARPSERNKKVLDKLLQHPSNTCHVFIEALRKTGPNNNDLVERLVKLDSESTFPYESQVSSDERLIGELIRYLRFYTVIGNSISNQV